MSRQTRAAFAAVVGLLVGLGTLAGVILALRESGGADGDLGALDTAIVETGATGALPPVDTEPVEETRTIEVGGLPNAVAVGESGVWVVRDGVRLVRIDPLTGTVAARVGVGDEIGSDRPCGVAVGAGAVWATTRGGSVARVNPQTNRVGRLIDVEDATCVAVGSGGVWVTSPSLGLVTRIDPATNETVAEIPIGSAPLGIATGFGAVWVASPGSPEEGGGTVTRIDRQANAVAATIDLPGLPEYVATGANGVWVTGDDGTVTHIDPRGDEIIEPASQVAETGRTTVAVGGGSVWAAPVGALGTQTGARIDPSTGQVADEPVPVGESPLGMDFGSGSLWVANYETGTVTAFTPAQG